VSDEKLVVLLMMVVNGLGLCLLERLRPHSGTPAAGRRRHLLPNLALTGLLIAVNFGFDRLAGASGARQGSGGLGLLRDAALPVWAKVLTVVVVLDGLAYLAHVLMHTLPPAWRFHRVHHSDALVDVTTAFRQHPLETLWRYSFQFAGAMALGASSQAVAIYLACSALNAQLEHADVALPPGLDRALRTLFSTPAMHRVHHSRAQADTDRNYSNIFSFWDRLFGTYRAPRAGERIACGLDEFDAPDRQRTVGLLALPFES
jgi:sterol desaturase/sphingolipid hydroxylase (fatty acid hydroxylase superfamily)